jgi:16S rRNA G966 N2-methylase RsmD
MAIESHPGVVKLLQENASKLALEKHQWQLVSCSLDATLTRTEPPQPFDVLLLDPPYELSLKKAMLEALMQPPWSMPNHSRFVIEQASGSTVNAEVLTSLGFHPRVYGSTTLWLL